MQKSKSSSNVGQFVSKKIWKTRSKSQTRTALSNLKKPDWTPEGNCVWLSGNGKRLILTDTKLNDLTEIERNILHRVAIDKINQLNIGVNITVPIDSGSSGNSVTKSQKRRPLLIKRKAVTTSFFDSGKNKYYKEISNGLIFGITLEKCLENDQRIRSNKNSISSLIDNTASSKSGIGSCDSLINKSNDNNLINSITMKISRSQSDIRRNSQQDDNDNNINNSESSLSSSIIGINYNNNYGERVPSIVSLCIQYLEDNGLHTVGIFRVSTSKKRVKQLKDDFDRGGINILDTEICPHDVATLLKEYFRELPEPLLCKNLYKAFVKTQKIRNRRLQLEAISHLVQLLPVAHRDTLYKLLKFLAKIVRYSDDVISNNGLILSHGNKMDSNNLATVFAPNLLRENKLSTTNYDQQNLTITEREIDEQIHIINVIRTMIDHYEDLFKIPAQLMDEIYTNMLDTFPQQLDYLCEKRDIKNDDEMDSGSSNTPLSSPSLPISSIQDGKSQIFNQFCGNDNNKLLTKLTKLSSTKPRRIYSREVVMHENAAKGDNENENNKIIDINLNDNNNDDDDCDGGYNGSQQRRERDRQSKMKYVSDNNDNNNIRRRRRDRILPQNNNNNNINNNIKINSINNNNDDKLLLINQQKLNDYHSIIKDNDISTQQQIERRLSIPQILQHNNTRILSASLKIPVQVQQTHHHQQHSIINPIYSNNDHKLDLSDIPYIEDGNNAQDYGLSSGQLNTPITGSLSIGVNNDYEILRSSSLPLSTGSSFQQLPQQNIIKKFQISNNNNKSDNNNDNNSNRTDKKITPSITNIGSDVLRSKTADFEKILLQKNNNDKQQLKKSIDNNNQQRSNKISPQGQIYKRQELISSAKTIKK